jgi:heat shock protein HslJ
MPRALALAALALLAACGDETISTIVDRDATYVLTAIDGTPFPARATIRFPAPTRIAGEGPCNGYTAEQSAPHPWFEPGPLATTERACADPEETRAEAEFFRALSQMRQADLTGPVLRLTDTGRRTIMVFRAEAPDAG